MLNHNSLMDEATPLKFHLSQNYPNPFSEKTIIKYCVAYKTRVQITIYLPLISLIPEILFLNLKIQKPIELLKTKLRQFL